MPVSEFNDDGPALDYIRVRGYASYSSIKNVRDYIAPTPYKEEVYFKFGKELHSRLLENKVLETLTDAEETMLAEMLTVLRTHTVVKMLLAKSRNEIDFGPAAVLKKYKSKGALLVPFVHKLPIYGRIDILNTTNVSDLKTTRLTSMRQFAESMDFLQAAIYLAATGRTDFFYIGASKVKPYPVMVFNVRQYPERLAAAEMELKRLCKYITKQI